MFGTETANVAFNEMARDDIDTSCARRRRKKICRDCETRILLEYPRQSVSVSTFEVFLLGLGVQFLNEGIIKFCFYARRLYTVLVLLVVFIEERHPQCIQNT